VTGDALDSLEVTLPNIWFNVDYIVILNEVGDYYEITLKEENLDRLGSAHGMEGF